MDDRMKLSIGAWEMEADKQFAHEQQQHELPPAPAEIRATAAPASLVSAPRVSATAASASPQDLIEVFETLKRHEETLRDLVVEIRLMYHSLPEKDRKRLEALRDQTTRQVHELFATHTAVLDGKIANLRGGSSL
jgi:hypothetical protein